MMSVLETLVYVKKTITVRISSFLFFCVCFILCGNSRLIAQSQLKVSYKVYCELIDRSAINSPAFVTIAEHARDVRTYIEKMIFELKITGKKSLFNNVDVLTEKNSVRRTAMILTQSGDYYKDFELQKFFKKVIFANKQFNVDFSADNSWVQSTEYKNILGYKCFMATKKNNSRIIAWYCPSIYSSDGPLNFYGLPGLILEVTAGNYTYVAYKIDFQLLKEITYDIGTIISEEQFIKIKENYMSENPVR